MKWIIFSITVLLFLPVFAQDPGSGTDINDNNDICCEPSVLNLPKILAGPGNFIASGQGGIDFKLRNLGLKKAGILMVLVDTETGRQQSGILVLEAGEEKVYPAKITDEVDEFYLVSLQNFHMAGLDKDGKVADLDSGYANPPSVRLNLMEIESPDGKILTVGVDGEFFCHYPVQGSTIGVYNKKLGRIQLEDGTELKARSIWP